MSDEAVFVLSIVLLTVSVPNTVVFWLSGRWHGRNVNLVRDDPDRYRARAASPPWYVRYSALVLGHRLPSIDTGPPKPISLRQARRLLRRTSLSKEDQAMVLRDLERAREERKDPSVDLGP